MKTKIFAILLCMSATATPCLALNLDDIQNNLKDGLKGGVKKTGEILVAETFKQLFSEIILKPVLIKPLQKVFGLVKYKKLGEKISGTKELAKLIEAAKKAGASKKQILELTKNLSAALDSIIKDNNKINGKK